MSYIKVNNPYSTDQRQEEPEKQWGELKNRVGKTFAQRYIFNFFLNEKWLNMHHRANHSNSLVYAKLRQKHLMDLNTDEATVGHKAPYHPFDFYGYC